MSAVRFSAGDWDFGSDTLADEVAALDPGQYVGEARHIDEVEDETTLLRIHVYKWDGDTWRPAMFDTPRTILVTVPPGTRVLYIESESVAEVRILDATELLEAPIAPSPLGVLGDPFGVPVFKAERMGP